MHTAAKAITTRMLQDLRYRFGTLLYPDTDNFNPIPAAACLLDPTLAQPLISPECAMLLHAAKLYVANACERNSNATTAHDETSASNVSPLMTPPTSLQRFMLLASKIHTSRLTAAAGASSSVSERDAIHTQLNNYIADLMKQEVEVSLHFWEQKLTRCSKLYELAQAYCQLRLLRHMWSESFRSATS